MAPKRKVDEIAKERKFEKEHTTYQRQFPRTVYERQLGKKTPAGRKARSVHHLERWGEQQRHRQEIDVEYNTLQSMNQTMLRGLMHERHPQRRARAEAIIRHNRQKMGRISSLRKEPHLFHWDDVNQDIRRGPPPPPPPPGAGGELMA
jgi:adenine deaminase